jgi:hypothetical protein
MTELATPRVQRPIFFHIGEPSFVGRRLAAIGDATPFFTVDTIPAASTLVLSPCAVGHLGGGQVYRTVSVRSTLSLMNCEEASKLHREVWNAVTGPALSRVVQPLRQRRKAVPDDLLHFTTAAGFVSILKDGILRLSRARASKDPMELRYGLDVGRAILDGFSGQELDDPYKESVRAAFEGKLLDGTDFPVPDPHICCFATAGSETGIPHWALYGRSGAGLVLVLDGKALSESKLDLVPVVYDVAQQQRLLTDALELGRKTARQAYHFGLQYGKQAAERACLVAGHAFGAATSLLAATMKRPSFEFEHEWRLLAGYVPEGAPQTDASINFGVEAVGPILRSYFEVRFPPEALKAIVVGSSHSDLNVPVVKAMLKEYRYESVEIRLGEIALRSFPL